MMRAGGVRRGGEGRREVRWLEVCQRGLRASAEPATAETQPAAAQPLLRSKRYELLDIKKKTLSFNVERTRLTR